MLLKAARRVNARPLDDGIGGACRRYQGSIDFRPSSFDVSNDGENGRACNMPAEKQRSLSMSHHYSGPDFGFPLGDARLDLTDVYVFPAPGDATRSVLIMNVHPSSTVIEPKSTTTEPFSADALYEIKIDTDGDAVANIAYRIQVSSSSDEKQVVTVIRAEGARAAGTGIDGEIIIYKAPVSSDREALISRQNGYQFFAGWRSEPFFFDTLGALNNLQFTGADFFADKDVCSIVLEVLNSELGSAPVSLWARVLVNVDGNWRQVERGARPQQAVFLPGADKEAYLAGEPSDDARFVPVFAHALEHTGGYSPREALQAAQSLLPDVMHYDPSRPASFPHNGRALTDDAADVFLAILTNGKIPKDGVGAHRDLLNAFPYLGPPHNA
jgi:hypothetical protein